MVSYFSPRYSLHPRVSVVEKLLNARGMSALVLLGLSHTGTNLPSLTDPNAPDTFDAACMQYAYPIDWRGLNQQIGQGEVEIAGTLSSLSAESYMR